MTVTEHIRRNLLTQAGVREPAPSLDSLRQTEWSTEFETMMRNRLVMGALRYGKLGSSDKPQYARIEAMHNKLNEYDETGNLELLVDVGNLSMCEFVESHHPKKHFRAIGIEQQHVERSN